MKTSRFRAFSRLLHRFAGLCGDGREFSYALPNHPRYQLRYTPKGNVKFILLLYAKNKRLSIKKEAVGKVPAASLLFSFQSVDGGLDG